MQVVLIARNRIDMPRITLTFDNGPDAEATPQVLDILARRDIRATFFVVGNRLAQPALRALAERAHDGGHWIGNHTFSHDVPLGRRADRDGAREEIGTTQSLIGDLAHARRLFRPFGGGGAIGRHLLNRACLDHLVAGKYTCVLWNAIPGDWKDPEGWIDTALGQCAGLDWSLVVLHDLPTGAMRHLDAFITAATDRGATFVQDFPPDCVPIERGEVVRDVWGYTAVS
jgi:peptidoglycan/xylan/chitin deacetylase (PgdA/CDA1 family)